MGLLEKIFRPKKLSKEVREYFQSLTAYNSVFTNYQGGVYEMELTRSAIHCYATACSKLKPEINGSAKKHLKNVLQFKPNPFMDTTKFLYRLATILAVNNNAFIVPIEDSGGSLVGFYPILPQNAEIMESEGVPYMRYTFSNGKRATIEFSRVGILNTHQYNDDFFGEDNRALHPTMQLINTNNEGIMNGVKNSANIRFLAKLGNLLKAEEITKERDRFSAENLSSENKSGLVVYDNKFTDLKQIDSKPFIVNSMQMQQINENVFNYFGTNINILQNKFSEDEWNAYYEGKVEPFAIQLSLVLSNMVYTDHELAHKNSITITANRVQYASNQTKLAMSTQLFDRGILSLNQVMDIWQMSHVEGGDKRYIRREYADIDKLGKKEE